MTRRTNRREHLVRALNLLPYFERHPGRTVFEAARDLGRDPGELMRDMDRLYCCGRPGLMPDDLVDLEHDYRRVKVLDNQGLDKALRLTTSEAVALLLALESLENVPGIADGAAVRSAAEKLRAVTGGTGRSVADATPRRTAADQDSTARTTRVLRAAIAAGRRVSFTYASATSDTTRTREVSPARLFTSEGQTYLRGLDHTADGTGDTAGTRDTAKCAEKVRTFRLDRMSRPAALTTAAEPVPDDTIDGSDPFAFGTSDRRARLRLRESMAWLADSVPLRLGERSGGWIAAELSYGSRDWLARFVLSHGDRLEVTGPAEVVELVAERRRAALAAYDVAETE